MATTTQDTSALSPQILTFIYAMPEVQLRSARNIINDRLNGIVKERRTKTLKQFKKGDLVEFTHGDQKKRAVVTRVNQKSLSALENGRIKWKIGHLTGIKKVTQ